MLVAAIVLAVALLLVAVSWGREMDRTADDAVGSDPDPGHRAA